MTLLLCALGFFIYLTDRNKHEVLRLRQELRDREIELLTLRAELSDKDILIEELRRQLAAKPKVKRFVSVIFHKDDGKCYDYFVGNNDVQVGDFVEVYVGDKTYGKPKRTIAQVVYLSEPDEVSKYAKSAIKGKSNRNKW